ncbi:hypothetical protein P9112_007566 [Eukaryota sp. TZLM1-RC]
MSRFTKLDVSAPEFKPKPKSRFSSVLHATPFVPKKTLAPASPALSTTGAGIVSEIEPKPPEPAREKPKEEVPVKEVFELDRKLKELEIPTVSVPKETAKEKEGEEMVKEKEKRLQYSRDDFLLLEVQPNEWVYKFEFSLKKARTMVPLRHMLKPRSQFAYNVLEERRKKSTDKLHAYVKETNGLLNKLSEENYRLIFNQLVLKINRKAVKFHPLSEEEFDVYIDEFLSFLFNKAVLEPTFSPLYARLCLDISKAYSPFKLKIISKCQESFTLAFASDSTDSWKAAEQEVDQRLRSEFRTQALDDVTQQRRDIEIYYMERKKRRKILGNIQFIGHLSLVGLLLPDDVFKIATTLINNGQNNSVEALTILLTIVGPVFSRKNEHKRMINELLEGPVTDFSVDKNLEKRVNFACLDLLDLWRNNWTTVPHFSSTKPKPSAPKQITTTEDSFGGFVTVTSRKRRPSYSKGPRIVENEFDLVHPKINPFESLTEDSENIRESTVPIVGAELDGKAKKAAEKARSASIGEFKSIISDLELSSVGGSAIFLSRFFYHFINSNPKSSTIRHHTDLLSACFKEDDIPLESLSRGLRLLMGLLDDLGEDFPNCYICIAQLLNEFVVRQLVSSSNVEDLLQESMEDSWFVEKVRFKFRELVV